MMGIQWGKSQIRGSEGGQVHGKKIAKTMIGMTVIREKRGSQWDRDQIMVQVGSIICFYLAELYSDLKNTIVLKSPNS
jgi:hypothetical protein